MFYTIMKVILLSALVVILAGCVSAKDVVGAGTRSTREANSEATPLEAKYQPSTQEATNELTTREATYEFTTREATNELTTREATREATYEFTTREATNEPTTREATYEFTTRKATNEPTTREDTRVSTNEPITEEATNEATTQVATNEPTTQEPTKPPPPPGRKVVCYVTTNAADRPGFAKFMPDDLDPTLCTHAVYGFAGLDADYNVISQNPDIDLDEDEEGGSYGGYRKFVGLRSKNPYLKALLGVGGYDQVTNGLFSQMAQETHAREIFIQNAVEFLHKYGFDGINIDWYFPGRDPLERDNLAKLLQEISMALEGTELTVSVAVSPRRDVLDHGYNVPRISEVADFMSIMAFDFHTCDEKFTHHHTGLGSTEQDEGDAEFYNVMSAALYFVDKGASPEKLLLGIPTYGRTYSLDDVTNTDIYSRGVCGQQGTYTRNPGFLSYFEFCDMRNEYWMYKNITYTNGLSSPYALYSSSGTGSHDQWMSFDDEESIQIKCGIANSLGFGGATIWSVESDDFLNWCSKGEFPLTRLVAERCSGRYI